MKVLLYGYDLIIRKAKSALISRGDEVVNVSRLDAVTNRQDLGDFSLTIVDMTAPHATEVCVYLKKSAEIPVVVILGFGEEGWRKLEEVGVDGYIHRSAGENEMVARLGAIERRVLKPVTGKLDGAR
ncbi:MAG: hypothetical protein Q8O43_06515 [Dehalococcoidia bacterium]|nr:hypothetical protein [Dehalococcoidia bacterium]